MSALINTQAGQTMPVTAMSGSAVHGAGGTSDPQTATAVTRFPMIAEEAQGTYTGW